MKQSQSIEIAYLINGEVVSVRRLSQTERVARGARGVRSGGPHGGGRRCDRRVGAAGGAPGRLHARPISALWAAVGSAPAGAGGGARRAPRAVLQHRGRHRRRRVLGAGAAAGAPDARRLPAGDRSRLHRSHRRRPSAARGRGAGCARARGDLPLELGMRAEVRLGPGDLRGSRVRRRRPAPAAPAGFVRRFARRALLPLELAALAASSARFPSARQIGEADMKSAIPARRHALGDREGAARRGADAGARAAPVLRRRCRSPASTRATSAWGCLAVARRGDARSTGSRVRPTAPTAPSSSACPTSCRPGSSSRCPSR